MEFFNNKFRKNVITNSFIICDNQKHKQREYFLIRYVGFKIQIMFKRIFMGFRILKTFMGTEIQIHRCTNQYTDI